MLLQINSSMVLIHRIIFSYEELLYNSLNKISNLETNNPKLEDIKEYFKRLSDLTRRYINNLIKKEHHFLSHFPLVPNRQTFDSFGYKPLEEFKLSDKSLHSLENILFDSFKTDLNREV